MCTHIGKANIMNEMELIKIKERDMWKEKQWKTKP